MKVGEVVNDQVSGFARCDFLIGFGVQNTRAAPCREHVTAIWSCSVGLAGELGHAIFIMDLIRRDVEEVGKVGVEF